MPFIIIILICAAIAAAAASVLHWRRRQQADNDDDAIPSYTLDDRQRSPAASGVKRPQQTLFMADVSKALAWLASHDTVIIYASAFIISCFLYGAFLHTSHVKDIAVTATEAFIRGAQENGRITQAAYQAYLHEISGSLHVDFIVTRHDASGADVIETTDIVLAALENGTDNIGADTLAHVYTLSAGDDIQIRVSREGLHLYDTLAAAFAGVENDEHPVIAVKGGVVRKEGGS